jgi:nucleotide-binding universal stress UspA family protein
LAAARTLQVVGLRRVKGAAVTEGAVSQGVDVVLVVGVDLSDVSEHLLATVRDLARTSGKAQMHVVHVVPPEPLARRLAERALSLGLERARVESAQWELERLCGAIVSGFGVRCVIHIPIGDVAEELTRVARETHADALVVEAHGRHSRVLGKSVVVRIAKNAPCSVLTVRQPVRQFVALRDGMPRASGT